MKFLKEFSIILAVSFLGEALHALIPLPIPGSVYGLVLMLLALCTHLLKLDQVRGAAGFLIEIMPVMFIPAAVGLLDAWGELRPVLVPVAVAVVVATPLVMAVTGKVTDGVIHLRGGRTKGAAEHE